MDKFITVGGKEVGFRATALTPRLYRHKFGRDVVRDMNQLRSKHLKAIEAKNLTKPDDDAPDWKKREYETAIKDAQMSTMDLEIFENVAYIMAHQFSPDDVPDSPDDWLDQFEMFSIYKILPHIFELWNANQKTTSVPKKK